MHLGIHDHHVSNGTCCESLDFAYQCVGSDVMKIPTAQNSTIVMTASKQFLANYLLKSPSHGEGHHLKGASLEIVLDKFTTLASSNFMFGSKRFVQSGMGTMQSITALKYQFGLQFLFMEASSQGN